jgi:hypothetical protein
VSGLQLATGVPFLGPAVAAWIALIVGVMTFFYLSVARQTRAGRESDRPELGLIPPVEPSIEPPPRLALPSYDMENYPPDRWGTAADATASGNA